MSRWVEGRVVAHKRWTAELASISVEADVLPFEAGQFAKLALEVDGEMLARPYSFVNSPHESPHEFYYITVPDGPLTQRLAVLEPGDRLFVSPGATGFLVLSEVSEGDNLWLIASGTGLGPFLSILKSPAPWTRFKRVTLVHAVRHAQELTYRACIESLSAQHPGQFRSVAFVSREDCPGTLHGRIPSAIQDGRLEQAAGVPLSAEGSQVLICGNPDMVTDTTETLKRRGMKKHRRRDPGQISVETYW
jgi:ferredoxin--NADP+ reductase